MHVMLKAKIDRSEFQSLAVSSRALATARAASRVQRHPDRPKDRRAVYSADSAMKIRAALWHIDTSKSGGFRGPFSVFFWWLEVRIFDGKSEDEAKSKKDDIHQNDVFLFENWLETLVFCQTSRHPIDGFPS